MLQLGDLGDAAVDVAEVGEEVREEGGGVASGGAALLEPVVEATLGRQDLKGGHAHLRCDVHVVVSGMSVAPGGPGSGWLVFGLRHAGAVATRSSAGAEGNVVGPIRIAG